MLNVRLYFIQNTSETPNVRLYFSQNTDETDKYQLISE